MSIHVKGGRNMRTNEELAVLVKQGDRQAVNELWEQVRRLVNRITARYFSLGKKLGVSPAELLQEAAIGMLRAVHYYRPEKGRPFISYLDFNIRGAVFIALGMRNGKEPPPRPLSLDVQIEGHNPDYPIFMYDIIEDPAAELELQEPERDLYMLELRAVMNERLDALKPKQRQILHARFWEGKTLQQAAEDIGVTRQRAQQLEQEAFAKLRLPQSLRKLRPFMYV
jgi:RNA polymerase sigma factor (sigma-70 family)